MFNYKIKYKKQKLEIQKKGKSAKRKKIMTFNFLLPVGATSKEGIPV